MKNENWSSAGSLAWGRGGWGKNTRTIVEGNKYSDTGCGAGMFYV